MDINWMLVHKIVIDSAKKGQRPNKKTLTTIRRMLPDVKILGFGVYGVNDWWYILVETQKLSSNGYGIPQSVSLIKLAEITNTPLINGI